MRRFDKKTHINTLNKKMLSESNDGQNEKFNTKYLGDGKITIKVVTQNDVIDVSGEVKMNSSLGSSVPPKLEINNTNTEYNSDIRIDYDQGEDNFKGYYEGKECEIRYGDDNSRRWLGMLEIKYGEWIDSHRNKSNDSDEVSFNIKGDSDVEGKIKFIEYGPNNIPVIEINVNDQTNLEYIFYRENDNNFIISGRHDGKNSVEPNEWTSELKRHYYDWVNKNENTIKNEKNLLNEMSTRMFDKLCGVILNEGLIGESNDCDCCEYFDYQSLSDHGFDKPLYYLIEKWKKLELVYMPPKQYIYRIARNFGGLSYEDAIGHVNDDNIKKYAEAMKKGDKFPIGHYTEGGSGQEGRHRALAAMRLGCESIPVLKITNLEYDDVMEFIENHKDYGREEMDRLFDNEAYKGVHNLGWQNFDRRRNRLNDE